MSKSGTKLRMALHLLSEVQKYSTTLLEENNSLLRDSNCKWIAKLPELRDFIPTLVESASASLYEQHSCMSTGGSKHLQNAMESLWKYIDQLTHRSSYSAPLNVHEFHKVGSYGAQFAKLPDVEHCKLASIASPCMNISSKQDTIETMELSLR